MIGAVVTESLLCILLQFLLGSAMLSFRRSLLFIVFFMAYIFVLEKYLKALESLTKRKATRYLLLILCFAAQAAAAVCFGYLDMELARF